MNPTPSHITHQSPPEPAAAVVRHAIWRHKQDGELFGVEIRAGRNALFIDEDHLQTFIETLSDHADELTARAEEQNRTGTRPQRARQWRRLAQTRAIRIGALEQALEELNTSASAETH